MRTSTNGLFSYIGEQNAKLIVRINEVESFSCVGNKIIRMKRKPSSAYHSHACGEQSSLSLYRIANRGSSLCVGNSGQIAEERHGLMVNYPCVWGTCFERDVATSGEQIILMCARNSSMSRRLLARNADHPYLCREQSSSFVIMRITSGSSPCARGTAFIMAR